MPNFHPSCQLPFYQAFCDKTQKNPPPTTTTTTNDENKYRFVLEDYKSFKI
jgi:hypothetical protein